MSNTATTEGTQATDEVMNDMAAASAITGEQAPVTPDVAFDPDFDFFAEFDGGVDSGIEDLYRRKFEAGLNKDCRFLGLTFEASDNFKLVKAKFRNDDQWEEDYAIFVPEAREITLKDGSKQLTWYPETMRDTDGLPLENSSDAKFRMFGGVKALDANGRVQRLPNNEILYRNETEAEAKKRKLNDFRCKLNSFVAAFCKDNMAEAMQFIVAMGRVTSWEDYMNRVQKAIIEFAPNYKAMPVTLKLHRRYDKTTSNKCSERYLELPKDMGYGLFMEVESEEGSVLTISRYEQEKKIDAPKGSNTKTGLNSPAGGSKLPNSKPAGRALPGSAPAGNSLPKATVAGGMSKLPK